MQSIQPHTFLSGLQVISLSEGGNGAVFYRRGGTRGGELENIGTGSPFTTALTTHHLLKEPEGSALTPNYPQMREETKQTRTKTRAAPSHSDIPWKNTAGRNQGGRKSPPMFVLNKTCRPACIFQRAARIILHSADSSDPTHPNTAQTEEATAPATHTYTQIETHVNRRRNTMQSWSLHVFIPRYKCSGEVKLRS